MRTRTALRWPALAAALASVLVAAGSAPAGAEPDNDAALYAQCRQGMQDIAEEHSGTEHVSIAVVCKRSDGTVVDPKLWMPAAPVPPAPTPVSTGDQFGCITGPGRPVIGTALATARATAGEGETLIYEHGPLDGSETISSSGSAVHEFGLGDLVPGGNYRWRARVDADEQAGDVFWSPDDDELGWSPWCEFTVSADAVDYRKLGDVSLEALNELGLRPDRKYTVTLCGRQRRLLRAGTDIGPIGARMTLTGPRWTGLLLQLTGSAFLADEAALETNEGDPLPPDGTAYRRLVDAISVKLGGPRHPDFG
ncbi:hypothetical protein [Actinoplanes aureus]|uniref:Secreted protein n=1 Tax=Actinoplanes aureus TaxID=2792083 RepID=A0A931CKY6_9ACTN|nr:hypothetical protein [Actinoplanes aureus]MBG0569303.1 hypothetical protein [Actinoplanes aureus]